MNSIIKLPLFVFFLLLSFNAVSGLNIIIYKGAELSSEASGGSNVKFDEEIHKYSEKATASEGSRRYSDFLESLVKLRGYRGYFCQSSSNYLRAGGIETMVGEILGLESKAPSEASGFSGLSKLLMPDAPISHTFGPDDVLRITGEKVERLVRYPHTPFEDLVRLDMVGQLGPEACRRLREDFIAFHELVNTSGCEEGFTELFNFYFENLQNANIEDTVISAF